MSLCSSCHHPWSMHHDGICHWRGGTNNEDFCLCLEESPDELDQNGEHVASDDLAQHHGSNQPVSNQERDAVHRQTPRFLRDY